MFGWGCEYRFGSEIIQLRMSGGGSVHKKIHCVGVGEGARAVVKRSKI